MDRSEVWWADMDQPIGRRPVLILTRSEAVPKRSQLVVAQLTRTARGLASEVPLTLFDGVPQDCVVNCDVLITVEEVLFQSYITTLSVQKMKEVETALKFSLDLP